MAGLWIPGAPVIGNVNQDGDRGNVDLSDIDLTVETLTDKRVRYGRLGTQQFIGANGYLQSAPENTWPLEYLNGTPVGRSEPGPQSTNLIPYATDFTKWRQDKAAVTANAGIALDGTNTAQLITTLERTSGEPIVYITPRIEPGDYTLTIVVRAGSTNFVHAALRDSANTNSTRVFANLTTLETSVLQVAGSITAAASAITLGDWVLLTAHFKTALPAGSYFLYFGPSGGINVGAATGDSIYATFAQFEKLIVGTSLITTTGVAATRAAAFASVRVWPWLTGIRLHYSNNTVDSILLNGSEGDWYQLPFSTRDWATRKIRRISYYKE